MGNKIVYEKVIGYVVTKCGIGIATRPIVLKREGHAFCGTLDDKEVVIGLLPAQGDYYVNAELLSGEWIPLGYESESKAYKPDWNEVLRKKTAKS